jgi:hypothetical protein
VVHLCSIGVDLGLLRQVQVGWILLSELALRANKAKCMRGIYHFMLQDRIGLGFNGQH